MGREVAIKSSRVAVIVLAAALAIAAAPTGAAKRPSTQTRIVFGGFDKIRSMRADGSGVRTLAKVDPDPSHKIISLRGLGASKNGKRIVAVTEFISSGPSGGLINRMLRYNGRGRNKTPLLHPFYRDGVNSAALSADGRKIVYPKDGDLHLVKADGHGVRRLTTIGRAKHPSFSRNGRRVAFERNSSGNQDIWVVNVRTGSTSQLTSAAADETDPSFSPNGSRIAYGSDAGGGRLMLMRSNGSGRHTVVPTHAGEETDPDFSPGGGAIVFVKRSHGNFRFFTVKVGGSHLKRVNASVGGKSPQWTRLP